VFELILSLLFEAPSDTEHKFYVLSLLNLILAQSIQATLQIHQILPKFILHMRLESNPQILKMMSSCIQKIMFIKSDITSFKAVLPTPSLMKAFPSNGPFTSRTVETLL
jgi:hypothetical protein